MAVEYKIYCILSEGVVKDMNTYEVVTQRVIEAIETTKSLPWRRPWRTHNLKGKVPANLSSKKPYHGINVFLLSMMGFSSPYWVTFKQAKSLGGSVRKGEKGTPVIYWSILEKRNDETKEIEKIPFIKHSMVFNVEQCEGLEVPADDSETIPVLSPIDSCEAIVKNFANKPKIVEREQQAYYRISDDTVNMPRRDSFESAEAMYDTLYHELIHSCAHPSRLDRKIGTTLSFFGSESYSKEELIAQMGSSFLCSIAGIDAATFDDSVSYLQGWVSAFKEKPKMIIEAASQAQKSVDYILNGKKKAS